MKFRLLKPKSFRLSSIVMLRKFLMFAARWQRSARLVRRQLKTLRRRLSAGAPIWARKK